MIRYTYFRFSVRNVEKGTTEKQIFLYMPSFVFPFSFIQLGKQMSNQTIPCSRSNEQLSESINGICICVSRDSNKKMEEPAALKLVTYVCF